MAVTGGNGKFLLEMGGSQEFGGGGGGGFKRGGGKLLKVLYIIGRGVLTPLLYEDVHHIAYPLHFFQILSTPPPYFSVLSSPHSHCSSCCAVS